MISFRLTSKKRNDLFCSVRCFADAFSALCSCGCCNLLPKSRYLLSALPVNMVLQLYINENESPEW